MKVTLITEVDILDEDGEHVSTAQTQTVLEDDHRVDPADLIKVYDADRHNLVIITDEKGLHPSWDYPQTPGRLSRLYQDRNERSSPAPSSPDPTGPLDARTGGTRVPLPQPSVAP